MKKVFWCGLLVFFLMAGYSSMAAAAEPAPGDGAPHTLLNLYQSENTVAFGLKQMIGNRFYFASDVEYVSSLDDLALQAGAVYFFPYKVDLGVFFKRLWTFNIYLYPGAGLEYFRNSGKKFGYVVLGMNVLCFFTEAVYPVQPGEKPEWRTGISFSL